MIYYPLWAVRGSGPLRIVEVSEQNLLERARDARSECGFSIGPYPAAELTLPILVQNGEEHAPASSPCSACQFVDRRCLWPADDIQRHRLVGVAAEAADLKIKISRVECVAEAGRGLSRSFESEQCAGSRRHPPNGQLPSEPRPRAPPNAELDCRRCSRETSCPSGKNAPAWLRSASRYGLGFLSIGTPYRAATGAYRLTVSLSRTMFDRRIIPPRKCCFLWGDRME
jgi:hypothetical protein